MRSKRLTLKGLRFFGLPLSICRVMSDSKEKAKGLGLRREALRGFYKTEKSRVQVTCQIRKIVPHRFLLGSKSNRIMVVVKYL